MKYFAGVEGGATHSTIVICNENGETVATVRGPGTNHWQLGIPECAKRIADMVDAAKREANIPLTVKLDSLGLSLSGCEQKATNDQLEDELRAKHPDAAENYIVCSDTVGSIFTASSMGGMVLIAGTGSNALLLNPDGSSYRCGGWGHMIGDEGGAWRISHRAVKYVFDDLDNFVKAPYPIARVWRLIKEYFNIETQQDLLEHCYTNFRKAFYAGLCKKLSELANDGDKLSAHVFGEAGADLARYILAVADKVDKSLLKSGTLDIVCVGSVFLSWDLLVKTFIKELNKADFQFGLRLIRITKTMAYGATYMAADDVKANMPRNYQDNYTVFHTYMPSGKKIEPVHMNGNSIEIKC